MAAEKTVTVATFNYKQYKKTPIKTKAKKGTHLKNKVIIGFDVNDVDYETTEVYVSNEKLSILVSALKKLCGTHKIDTRDNNPEDIINNNLTKEEIKELVAEIYGSDTDEEDYAYHLYDTLFPTKNDDELPHTLESAVVGTSPINLIE